MLENNHNQLTRIAVVGGGAAGFFAAISAKTHNTESTVTLFEKTTKILSKVKISGGGRCNVTHSCFDNTELVKNYPRGNKFLKKTFFQFSVVDTIDWYKKRGVHLKTEKDNRMFPKSNNSQEIIDCLVNEFDRLGCVLKTSSAISKIKPRAGAFKVIVNDHEMEFDKIIIATGGSPKEEGLLWLKKMGHKIEKPVPSLFTFNMPSEKVKNLMGISVLKAKVRVEGEKTETLGPLLITHWGMSGPAILKLSAIAARLLAEKKYHFSILVNWFGNTDEKTVRALIENQTIAAPKIQISNSKAMDLPKKLWLYLLEKINLEHEKRWCDLSKKERNRLVNSLVNDRYKVGGKTTFKEEFVTCGGISLNDVDPNTMQSKVIPNLYFAGEVLDIDGVTGGFNFQAAWTTGFVAGKLN